MTREQLRDAGWVETTPGHWRKRNAMHVLPPSGTADASVELGPTASCEDQPGRASGSNSKGRTAASPKRIRQSSKPLLNKLEASFWSDYLELRYPKARAQALKFKLGNGIAYKPDFVDLSIQPVKAWEVKGPHAFRGGFENLKVAASLYPEVRWILVWKESGEWKQQKVLP